MSKPPIAPALRDATVLFEPIHIEHDLSPAAWRTLASLLVALEIGGKADVDRVLSLLPVATSAVVQAPDVRPDVRGVGGDLRDRLQALVSVRRGYEVQTPEDTLEAMVTQGIVTGLQMALDQLSHDYGITLDDPMRKKRRAPEEKVKGAILEPLRRDPPPATSPSSAPPQAPRSSSSSNGAAKEAGNGKSTSHSGERALLTAIAQYGAAGVTLSQLTAVTDYTKSTIRTYLPRLKERALYQEHGSGKTKRMVVTKAGLTELGPKFKPLPRGLELQEYWREHLPEGERRCFDLALRAYPKSITSAELVEALDYTDSTIRTYLPKLAKRQIVDLESGGMRAASILFDVGDRAERRSTDSAEDAQQASAKNRAGTKLAKSEDSR